MFEYVHLYGDSNLLRDSFLLRSCKEGRVYCLGRRKTFRDIILICVSLLTKIHHTNIEPYCRYSGFPYLKNCQRVSERSHNFLLDKVEVENFAASDVDPGCEFRS